MTIRSPHRSPARPPSPDDIPLMHAILNAAQQMFPGDPWEYVEPHLRRAWRTVLDPTPWEDVRGWMHTSWLKLGNGAAANDGADEADIHKHSSDDHATPPAHHPSQP